MSYYLLHAGQPSAKRLVKRVTRLQEYVSSNSLSHRDVVIRWGKSPESDPPATSVLNPLQAIMRTGSRVAMGRFLRRIGIRFMGDKTGSEPGRIVRHYRIPVFDLLPIACFRCDSNPVWINQRIQRVQDSFREVSTDDDRVTVRAARLATRVTHALGLDHGMVSIGLGPKGMLHVLDITATPVLKDRMLDLFSQAVDDYIDREERLRSRPAGAAFLLGADVELMLRNSQGKMVLASNYFSRSGSVGCDDRSVQFDGKRLPLMELRPAPEASPLDLLATLRDTMLQGTKTINRAKVEWRAGSMPFRRYCTGGHIHFSNIPYSSRFVRALDQYVGLPLMMVEDQRTARLRRPHYGFLGDVRHKDYGGFEYRTPGSFVVSPEVTAAAFCLAAAVAEHFLELPLFDIYEETTQLAFYNGQTELLLPVVERSYSALRRVAAYERYSDYIDPLFDWIRQGRTWDESADVRAAWGLPLQRPQRVRVRRQNRSAIHA